MICIVVPYGRGEATSAAIRLANFVLGTSADVRVVTTRPVEGRVHGYWDRHVVSAASVGMGRACRGASKFVHFHSRTSATEAARLAAPKAAHVHAPPFAKHTPPFDAGVAAIRRVASGSAPVLAVVADTQAAGDRGVSLFQAAAAVAECGVKVRLASDRQWSSTGRSEIKRLASRFGDAVSAVRWRGDDELARVFLASDWAYLPWLNVPYGTTVASALSCGVPVIAPGTPAFSNLITHGRDGVLVPCCNANIGRNLVGVVTDRTLLAALRSADWGLPAARDAFERWWCDRLGLAPRDLKSTF